MRKNTTVPALLEPSAIPSTLGELCRAELDGSELVAYARVSADADRFVILSRRHVGGWYAWATHYVTERADGAGLYALDGHYFHPAKLGQRPGRGAAAQARRSLHVRAEGERLAARRRASR